MTRFDTKLAHLGRESAHSARTVNPPVTRASTILYDSLDQLRESLSDDLQEELESIFQPLHQEETSESELRIVQAQLVGWLEGLFHGIQASIFSQQAAAAAQLDEMRRRRGLEAGKEAGGAVEGTGEGAAGADGKGTAQGTGDETAQVEDSQSGTRELETGYDDIVARQLREAAEKETDPELKKKLWEEYYKYKKGSQ